MKMLIYFRVKKMRMDDSAFDVIRVRIVFKSTLQKTSFFAELRHMLLIVISEHLIAKDCIRHLHQTAQEI